MLFIDQPIGTGFSWTNGNKVNSSMEAAKDLHVALEEFFILFPEMKARNFYFSGESYAAKWIPYLFQEIKTQNKLHLNIKGALIESATFDPRIQHSVYPSVGYYMGVTNYRDYVESNQMFEKCSADIDKKNWKNAKDTTCSPLFAEKLVKGTGLSPYDSRELYKDMDRINQLIGYMTTNEVKADLAIEPASIYHNCDANMFELFDGEFFEPLPQNLFTDLVSNMKVILYTGQFDLKSGFLGMNEYIRKLEWPGSFFMNNYEAELFSSNEAVYGNYNRYKNLTRMVIYGSGHMISETKGDVTLLMLQKFLTDESYCIICKNNPPCPNNCTIAGYCNHQAQQCVCDPGYSGLDCADGKISPVKFNIKQQFQGLIVGRGFNTYLIDFPLYDANYMNLDLVLKKTSRVGGPYVFVEFYNQHPNVENVKKQIEQKINENKYGTFADFGFKFSNTSEEPIVTISDAYIQLEKSVPLKMLIVVYNTNDFILKYDLHVQTEGQFVKWDRIAILVGVEAVVLVIIILEVLIYLYFFSNKNPFKIQLFKKTDSVQRESNYNPVSQLDDTELNE